MHSFKLMINKRKETFFIDNGRISYCFLNDHFSKIRQKHPLQKTVSLSVSETIIAYAATHATGPKKRGEGAKQSVFKASSTCRIVSTSVNGGAFGDPLACNSVVLF